LYDNIGGSEEDKTKEILEFLMKFEQQNKEQFDRIVKDLNENKNIIIESIRENKITLADLISEEVVKKLITIKKDTEQIPTMGRNIEKILSLVSLAGSESTPNTSSTIDEANKYFEERDYKKALENYDKVINDPNYKKALNNKGLTVYALDKNNVDEAIKYFDEAIEMDPNWPIPWYNKGLIFSNKERGFSKAIEYYDKVIEFDPKHFNKQDKQALANAYNNEA
jgi:tetratricopeptide (TPR) repeat protein